MLYGENPFFFIDFIGGGGDATAAFACGLSSGDSLSAAAVSLGFPLLEILLVVAACFGVGARRYNTLLA